MDFFGAFGGVLNGGTAHVEGNSAEVSGGTVSEGGAGNFFVERGIYGGYAHAQLLHGTQTRAEAVRNTYNLSWKSCCDPRRCAASLCSPSDG